MKRLLFLLLVLTAIAAYAGVVPQTGKGANQQDELLEAEKAFRLSTRVVDADTVEARWKIADGYYLYREKFKFEPLDDGVLVKEAKIPPGTKKHDEYFGDVETYRGDVAVRIALSRNESGAIPLKLKITSQGCADLGVCYPPQTQVVDLKLPAQKREPAVAQNKGVGALTALGNLIEPNADQEFLEPDQAFVLNMVATDRNTVVARIDIAKGYYLYRDKTSFQSAEPRQARLGDYRLPQGKVKVDEFFGKTEVYHDRLEVTLPVNGAGGAADLIAKYQGCAEKGICYPPITKKVAVEFPAADPVDSAAPAIQAAVADGAGTRAPGGAAQPRPSQALALAVLGAFGAGLLLTFTPCVLPMVPILSSVIVGTGDRKLSKLEGGLLSYAYVLGTAVTYTVAGAVAGASGEQLQAYFQNPWAIGIFAGLLVLLALSMFGFYELQMPGFVQSFLHHHGHRIHHHSKKLPGGTYAGVFVMGLLSALIIGACVSPVLISALGAAIAGKDPVLGAGIMFSLAHGQGIILVALGIGAGFLLPKAGHWMNQVKHVFGVLLLGVAIYLLGALPQVPVLLLWAALLIVTAVYLGATQSLPRDASGWAYLWKGIGTFFMVWGVFALLGGFAGSRDILQPVPLSRLGVQPVTAASPTQAEQHLFQRVTTVRELDALLTGARSAGKPAIVDFYATWCTDCVRMEKSTFTNPWVRDALARFTLVQVDVTDNTADSRAVKQRLEVLGPPAMAFFGPDGSERRELRFYGYKSPEDFLKILARL